MTGRQKSGSLWHRGSEMKHQMKCDMNASGSGHGTRILWIIFVILWERDQSMHTLFQRHYRFYKEKAVRYS